MNGAQIWENLNIKIKNNRDLPARPLVKDLPCNTGHSNLILGRGTKIPYAMEQLNSRPATREPVCLSESSHMIQRRFFMLQLRPNAAR